MLWDGVWPSSLVASDLHSEQDVDSDSKLSLVLTCLDLLHLGLLFLSDLLLPSDLGALLRSITFLLPLSALDMLFHCLHHFSHHTLY